MFRGCITALITPFKDGLIDVLAFRRLIEWQIRSGVSGLVPCGTTGESACLSYEEHDRVVALTVELAAGRVPVIAGTGSNCTKEAVRLTKSAEKEGADGALIITPYYNRPTQEGLLAHYGAIRGQINLPLLMYNVPKRTGCDLLPETAAQIMTYGGYVGIKEASGSLDRVERLLALGVPVLSGDDDLAQPAMDLGAMGVISVVANFAPEVVVGMCREIFSEESDRYKVLRYHEIITDLAKLAFYTTSPIPTKAILSIFGYCRNELRLPLLPLDDDLSISLANEAANIASLAAELH